MMLFYLKFKQNRVSVGRGCEPPHSYATSSDLARR
jgi:hypothetical protein